MKRIEIAFYPIMDLLNRRSVISHMNDHYISYISILDKHLFTYLLQKWNDLLGEISYHIGGNFETRQGLLKVIKSHITHYEFKFTKEKKKTFLKRYISAVEDLCKNKRHEDDLIWTDLVEWWLAQRSYHITSLPEKMLSTVTVREIISLEEMENQ